MRFGDEPYPVAGGLGDIFTDLLGRETKGTDLGGKSGRGTDLTSGGTEVNDLLLVRVELGSCSCGQGQQRVGRRSKHGCGNSCAGNLRMMDSGWRERLCRSVRGADRVCSAHDSLDSRFAKTDGGSNSSDGGVVEGTKIASELECAVGFVTLRLQHLERTARQISLDAGR